MIVGFIGVKRIMGFVGLEFVVVHVVIDVSGLAKSANSLKTRSLQLCLLRSGLDRWARGVTCSR